MYVLKTSVCLLALGALVPYAMIGCRSGEASGASQTAVSSPPPTMNSRFQTRNPRPCPSVKGRPSSAEAAALVQCTQDSVARDNIMLMQNVSVSVSRATQTRNIYDENDIDVSAALYPISGSMVVYNCATVNDVMNNAGNNCYVSESLKDPGYCYSNLAGDYRCKMGGGQSGFVHLADPPPTTY